MPRTFSIFLVDDHVVMRSGLKELLELSGPYHVTGEYENGAALIAALPFLADPDLIILDLTMPVMDGEGTVCALRDQGHNIPIIVLTMSVTDETIIRLYKMGVRGYLEKDCTTVNLLRAIDDVLSTGYHHNDLLTNAFIAVSKPKPADSREKILNQLTSRELEFLRLVCNDQEYTYDQIASKMNVSIRTVDGYRQSLFDKFDIKSKTGLVLFVIKHKLNES